MTKKKKKKTHDRPQSPNTDPKIKALVKAGKSIPKIEPGYYCNGRNKSKDKYCELRAGWGVKGKSTGRCRLHGGLSGRPAKFGNTGKKLLPNRLKHLEASVKGIDIIESLREKYIKLEAYILHSEELYDSGGISFGAFNNFIGMQIKEQRKLLDTVRRLYDRNGEISQAEFNLFIQRIQAELKEIIQDVSIPRDKIYETLTERIMSMRSQE